MSTKEQVGVGILSILIILIFIASLMVGIPVYKVWQQGQSGKAALAKAEQTRQVLVKQAQAERDSATLRAEAISIVGKAAKEYPEYRTQEFIGAFAEALHNGNIHQIIYVPTEANIPIIEEGHR